ncbi:MAG: response regulator [Byssovorax sp.]
MTHSHSSADGGLTVLLVVEDDDDYRAILAETLVEAGYRVESAIHGLDALARLRAGVKPAVILLDMMMPVMDGWSFVAALKEDTALSTIPVIATTGAGDRVLLSAPVSAAYLNKPINRERLLATIELCISRAQNV